MFETILFILFGNLIKYTFLLFSVHILAFGRRHFRHMEQGKIYNSKPEKHIVYYRILHLRNEDRFKIENVYSVLILIIHRTLFCMKFLLAHCANYITK